MLYLFFPNLVTKIIFRISLINILFQAVKILIFSYVIQFLEKMTGKFYFFSQ